MNKLLSILLVICAITLVKGQTGTATATQTELTAALVSGAYTCSFDITLTIDVASPAATEITVTGGPNSVGTVNSGPTPPTSPSKYGITLVNPIQTGIDVTFAYSGTLLPLTTPLTLNCIAPAISYTVSTQPAASTNADENGVCSYTAYITASNVAVAAPPGSNFTLTSNGTVLTDASFTGPTAIPNVPFTYNYTVEFSSEPLDSATGTIQLDGVALTLTSPLAAVSCLTLTYTSSVFDQASKTAANDKCEFTLTVSYTLNGATAPNATLLTLDALPTGVTATAFTQGPVSTTVQTYTSTFTTSVGTFNANNVIILNYDDAPIAGAGVAGETIPSIKCTAATPAPTTPTPTKKSDDSSSSSILTVGIASFFSALIVLLL